MRDGVNAMVKHNLKTRDGSASAGELIDRLFKLLGRVGEKSACASNLLYKSAAPPHGYGNRRLDISAI